MPRRGYQQTQEQKDAISAGVRRALLEGRGNTGAKTAEQRAAFAAKQLATRNANRVKLGLPPFKAQDFGPPSMWVPPAELQSMYDELKRKTGSALEAERMVKDHIETRTRNGDVRRAADGAVA